MKTTYLRNLLLLLLGTFVLVSCGKDSEEVTPSTGIETGQAYQIDDMGALVSVSLNLEDDVTVTEKGICWNDFGGPMVDDNKLAVGEGSGDYSGKLTGLQANTKYYVRSYYITEGQVKYGNEINFVTAESPFKGEWANANGTLKFTGSGQGLVFKVANTTKWAEAVQEGHVTLGTTLYLRNFVRQGKRYTCEALWNYGTASDPVQGVRYSSNTTVTFNASGSELQIESYSPIDGSFTTGTLYRQ